MAQPVATWTAPSKAARRAANPDRRHLHGAQRSAAILEGSITGAANGGRMACWWRHGKQEGQGAPTRPILIGSISNATGLTRQLHRLIHKGGA